jgi:photosystem II stability/assembly factor-like uncharacterized protein
MPDEIDLLRTFRSDTPGPGEAAWEKARAAVTAVAEPVPPAGLPRPRPRYRPRLQRRTAVIAGTVAVTAAVVAGVLVSVLPGSSGPAPTLHTTLATAWEPARALPSGPVGLKGASGQWRLTSYLSPRGWQENTSSPEQPAGLTCPTALTCYVEGNSATAATVPEDINSLYVSGDGGQTWSVLLVPAGVTFTSKLACTTQSDCAAGGLYYGHQGVYLSTTNGGHSWTVRPLGAGADQIIDLTCRSVTMCRGLLQTSTAGPWGPLPAWRVKLISTADGGRHFTVSSFPAGTSMQGLSCPTAAHCVAFGFPLPVSNAPEGTSDADTGVVLVTDDGGASWQRAPLPRNVGVTVPEVTCSDAAHCALLGYVIGPGSQGASMPASGSGKYTYADQYSVVGFSDDGGRSWTIRKLPKTIPGPFLNSLACPTAKLCYAVGQDDIPQKVGPVSDAGSAVIAVTRDGGQTWQPVRFAVPSRVPSGMADTFDFIGEIQCPQADVCVATGTYLQGSMSSVPVYTLNG